MSSPARSLRAALVLLTALLTVLVGVGVAAPAQAQAVTKQRVYGVVSCPGLSGSCPSIKMMYFDSKWNYLGRTSVVGRTYAIRLAPGSYYLQFVDQRASWDTKKYAPTNVAVRVSSRPVPRNVTMRRGGAVTGVATAAGKPLAGAKVVAANRAEQSFSTVANGKGQFAVGGLPPGTYCLFTYDRKKQYVGKCTYVGGINYAQVKNTAVRLRVRTGSMRIFVDTNDPKHSAPSSTLTITSRTTGQWWTTPVRGGQAVFTGLYPGHYDYKFEQAGIWFEATGVVRGANVRSNSPALGTILLTKRGGWITGTVVDDSATGRVLKDAVVQAWSSAGTKLGEATSNSSGIFTINGAIRSQGGVTLVVQPGPYSNYLGNEPYRCQYVRTPHTGYTVKENQENFVDLLTIKRLSPQTKVNCEA